MPTGAALGGRAVVRGSFISKFQLVETQKDMLEIHSFMLILGVFHNLEIWLS